MFHGKKEISPSKVRYLHEIALSCSYLMWFMTKIILIMLCQLLCRIVYWAGQMQTAEM